MKIALATLLALTPVSALADDYQAGYSEQSTCYREEYREEYVPGTADNPGYVRSWQETVEFPCDRTRIRNRPDHTPAPTRTRTRTYNEYEVDDNDCSDGTVVGGLLGGGLAGFGSRGKDRWWAIPTGIVGGAMLGCAVDGG
tara:strand:+ start:446 stop:868 length:423 start_codon:yes stop_codon:yes gene_type:complete